MKHTPGPWLVEADPEYLVIAPTGSCRTAAYVAVCEKRGTHDPYEREANARLIAAAPELLDACELVAGAIRWAKSCRKDPTKAGLGCFDWSVIEAAIAKATKGAA